MSDKKVNLSSKLALTWLAAAESGFCRAEDWQRWADSKIENFDGLPYWIYDVSLAVDISSLRMAASEATYELDLEAPGTLEIAPMVLGFYFLRFRLKQISLFELLKLAGLVADSGFAGIDPESFYCILNDLESSKISLVEGERLAASILKPRCRIAASNWNEMMPGQMVSCD